MKTNKEGIELIKHFEGCKLEAYLCPASVWTVGYGTTRYEDGRKVKQGDEIQLGYAELLLREDLIAFENKVKSLVKSAINENQFSALVSFTYNLGARNLSISTLLKKVNKNPNDPTIDSDFKKWINANGKPLNGLINRREAESKLYFKK